jgi:hypothetical protein
MLTDLPTDCSFSQIAYASNPCARAHTFLSQPIGHLYLVTYELTDYELIECANFSTLE